VSASLSSSRTGFLLALTTAVAWGTLPIALKAMLESMDAYTITWFRFLAAALIAGAWLKLRGRTLGLATLSGQGRWLLALAVAGLLGNYVLYLVGLDFVPPGTAQIVIQLAPLFLLLGGMVFFGERFRRSQWTGLAVLVAGLLLFFNNRLDQVFNLDGAYGRGVLLVILAAITWAAYALAQKRLLATLKPDAVLIVIYVCAVPLLLPVSDPVAAASLTGAQWWLLGYCCLNTLVAYGCFAEALRHWEASRVSAVLALTPLLTLLFARLLEWAWPGYDSGERLNLLSVAGALMVVAGSAICALSGRKAKT
jgi:drug/metabolite transporter (DMT)-like permease